MLGDCCAACLAKSYWNECCVPVAIALGLDDVLGSQQDAVENTEARASDPVARRQFHRQFHITPPADGQSTGGVLVIPPQYILPVGAHPAI